MNKDATTYKTDGTVETYPIDDDFLALAKQVHFLLIDRPGNGDADFLAGRSLARKRFIIAFSPDRNSCKKIIKDNTTMSLYMGTCAL